MTSTSSDPGDSLSLVCAACREGPFSYDGFRKAVASWHSNNTTGYDYTTTWQNISDSITKEDCRWCTIVRRTRDELPAENFPGPTAESVEVKIQITIGARKVLAIFLNGEKAMEYWIYGYPDDVSMSEIGRVLDTSKKQSYVDYEKAIQCVKACDDHEHCPAVEETYLPTRVIDCSDPSKPRLFETHRQIQAHYCTLSYVWGGEQHQKTTTANIDTYVREGINVPLPQTIADAILATNKLGCRYLWVDALCIIQDSVEDKVKELADMAHIYRDAYITLSVLSSFRADHGFLPDEREPDVVAFYTNGSSSAGRMLLEYVIPRPLPGRGKYETVVLHRPLDKRGWCLQESILPARRLIFQPPFLYYKCPSFTQLNISRPTQLDRMFYGQQTAYPVDDHILFQGKDSANPPADEGTVRERWRKLLLDYTERSITVPYDKLVALAGVAQIFGSLSKDAYVAGLWKKTLISDLLWTIWPPMGPDAASLPRPVDYRAPSWSWASVDAKLDLHTFGAPPSAATYEAEVLGVDVALKNETLQFGEVADAKLFLKAKIHPLMRDGSKCVFTEIKGARSEGNPFVRTEFNWEWKPPGGNCLEPVAPNPTDSQTDSDDGDDDDRVSGIVFDSAEGTAPDPPLDFFVVILRAGRQWRNVGDWMHGLLLLPVEGEAEQYRRVAKLNLQYDFQWPDWFDSAPLKTLTLV
ncbi:hypothetical protein CVT26_006431 [Gymnopilus dilepis]|uniref:Heterokaryon incompatibility domain-containing protein n=1 Tax=Gymnopilus dilepis TaxID=231916 RepID=A0A409Y1T7_9AGAR|nr:hypothetical protein CVT26_006431 [Gymnopilus dilepis]